MYIENIKLSNFRNYTKQEVNFDKNINIFYGNNAQGKTNIIEAIYLCAIGKSYRTSKEKEVIKINEEYSKIEVNYSKSDRNGKVKFEVSDKKMISLNEIKLKKVSEILGNINIVLFNPDDINIFKDGPAKRRRILDVMISQLRPAYVYNLNMYTKTLEQRNNYLKQIKYDNKSEEMLEIWEQKLADYAENVYLYRSEFVEKIKSKIVNIHKKITNDKEQVKIEYISDFIDKTEFIKLLEKNRKVDIIKGFTGKGIHRDDLKLYINDKEIGIYGSQGQHRSSILSIKLSELEIIKDETDENPILLLDDFMSELDKVRRENFLEDVKDTQIIITCTDKLEIKNEKKKIFYVENRNC
ncbi:MAG: DNA replication/repair protein RecF [Clostridia bacterium]|nr:DNA replication/repair protein RecF [Clostridia bacterium]